jgi:hypothetical protein
MTTVKYSLFTSCLTHCPHPKSLSQKGRGTLKADRIISEQAVTGEHLNQFTRLLGKVCVEIVFVDLDLVLDAIA